MAKAGRVIKNRHAHCLAIDWPVIIHPSSSPSPSSLISNSIGIDYAPSFFAVHIHTSGYSYAKARILFVTQHAVTMFSGKDNIYINNTLTLLHLEDMSPLIG